MSSAGRDGLKAEAGTSRLYQHLPRGPHRLSREAVERHQRLRMHGAMIAAVAANGYGPTTVKHVITMAGVSRRVFYEMFDNKLDCFLRTLDVITDDLAGRIACACRERDESLEGRLSAALSVAGIGDWEALRLLIAESQTAGAPGLIRLYRATVVAEEALASAASQSTGELPAPLAPAVVGAWRGMLAGHLREGSAATLPTLGRYMLAWTRAFAEPTAVPVPAPAASVRFDPGVAAPAYSTALSNERGRDHLCDHLLRVVVSDGYEAASLPLAADRAGMSIDRALELFGGKDECFLAALDMARRRLLTGAVDAFRSSADWPGAVRDALARVMLVCAEHAEQTRALLVTAPTVGADALDRALAIGEDLAALLLDAAPAGVPAAIGIPEATVRHAVAGMIWHTIQRQVIVGRTDLLPARAGYVSWAVMTPFLGSREAAANAGIRDSATSGVRSIRSATTTRPSRRRAVSA